MEHPLNDDAAKLINEFNALPAVDLSDPAQFAQMRAAFDQGVEVFRGNIDIAQFDVRVTDAPIESVGRSPIPARCYEPAHQAGRATVAYFHGGGWNMGSLETLDPEMRWFAHRLGAVVVSVDYRLAPEHAYPAAFDDCLAALQHLHAQNPERPLAVAGDSAGGNLAAAVSIAARDTGIALAGQFLIYPALDSSQASDSHEELAEGYLLTRAGMEFNWSSYLQTPAAWTEPLASPSNLSDTAGLAPAVVLTAGYDPLRDEGVDYAERLRIADARSVHLHHPGLPHGFLVMSGRVPAVRDALEQALYHFGRLIDSA